MSLTKITVLERGLYNKVLMYKLLEEYNKRILIILYKGEKKNSKTKVSQHFNQNQYASEEHTHLNQLNGFPRMGNTADHSSGKAEHSFLSSIHQREINEQDRGQQKMKYEEGCSVRLLAYTLNQLNL